MCMGSACEASQSEGSQALAGLLPPFRLFLRHQRTVPPPGVKPPAALNPSKPQVARVQPVTSPQKGAAPGEAVARASPPPPRASTVTLQRNLPGGLHRQMPGGMPMGPGPVPMVPAEMLAPSLEPIIPRTIKGLMSAPLIPLILGIAGTVTPN